MKSIEWNVDQSAMNLAAMKDILKKENPEMAEDFYKLAEGVKILMQQILDTKE